MSSSPAVAAAPESGGPEPNHTVRFATLWVVVTVIALPLVIWVIGPLIGPGSGSDQASAVRHRLHRAGRDRRRRC